MSVLLHRLAVLSSPVLAAVGLVPLATAVIGDTAIHHLRTRKTHR